MQLQVPCLPQFKMFYCLSKSISFDGIWWLHVYVTFLVIVTINVVKRHPNFEKYSPLEAAGLKFSVYTHFAHTSYSVERYRQETTGLEPYMAHSFAADFKSLVEVHVLQYDSAIPHICFL